MLSDHLDEYGHEQMHEQEGADVDRGRRLLLLRVREEKRTLETPSPPNRSVHVLVWGRPGDLGKSRLGGPLFFFWKLSPDRIVACSPRVFLFPGGRAANWRHCRPFSSIPGLGYSVSFGEFPPSSPAFLFNAPLWRESAEGAGRVSNLLTGRPPFYSPPGVGVGLVSREARLM